MLHMTLLSWTATWMGGKILSMSGILTLKTAKKNILRKSPLAQSFHDLWWISQVEETRKKIQGQATIWKRKMEESSLSWLPKKKDKVSKDDTCFECGVVGKWKRNFHIYLDGLKAKKVGEGNSGIYTFKIEMGLSTFSSNTLVFDTIV